MQTRPCPTCGEPWGFAFRMCPFDRTPLPELTSPTQPRLAAFRSDGVDHRAATEPSLPPVMSPSRIAA